ncbi:hypothetical protein EJ04DRAFT_530078 [Polyplosphaeria fusca]|uniref:N-acetyltransferase domain-containing protein n=1 Tax=Polyplosphaeria fusca TaxID=682080 RepID=A0A9P4QKN0_9PLEO|nr:hypothetical protein EJ04DRAFT_530078 [Polyplosphaeria fusca]
MSLKRTISISQLSDDEMPTAFTVVSKSFGHDAPFIDNFFPLHDTPSGQMQGTKRLASWKNSSPSSTFLKAELSAGNEAGGGGTIVGIAVWTLMDEAPPTELSQVADTETLDGVWPDGSDREFMARLWKKYVVPRTQAIAESGGVLELLAVHPHFQRLGAGAALVEWGTSRADATRRKAIVEGTPVGRFLYERCGFLAEIEEMDLDAGEEFAQRKLPKLIFLTRNAK